MRAVICDTSPLQYLHQIGFLHLLPTLFGTVQVPLAVAAEIGEGRQRGVPLPELAGLSWVTTRPVDARRLTSLPGQLGRGEKEVLALGLEAAASLLVLDDRDARRHAIAMGLEITGTVGLLLLAKERGVLDLIQPALDRLQGLRFRLSTETRRIVLNLAGEKT